MYDWNILHFISWHFVCLLAQVTILHDFSPDFPVSNFAWLDNCNKNNHDVFFIWRTVYKWLLFLYYISSSLNFTDSPNIFPTNIFFRFSSPRLLSYKILKLKHSVLWKQCDLGIRRVDLWRIVYYVTLFCQSLVDRGICTLHKHWSDESCVV